MSRGFINPNSRALGTASVVVVVGLVSVWLLLPWSRFGTSLVRSSYDWSQSLSLNTSPGNSPVVIVYLDLDSYLREKQNPVEPWNRAVHARLLNRLTAAGAAAVVFDIIFDQANPAAPADQEFARALRANRHAVLAAEISGSSRQTPTAEGVKSLQLSLPAARFLDSAAAWGLANMSADSDFVVRRDVRGFSNPEQPTLAVAVARLLGMATSNQPGGQWLRYYGKPLTLPHVSYSAALNPGEVGDQFFRGKTVFIGARPITGVFLERRDQFRSPFASWGENELFMPAVEVHATQLLNILRGDSLKRHSPAWEGLVLVCSAFVFAWALFYFRPLPAAVVALIAECVVFGAVVFIFTNQKTWFPWLIIEAVQIPAALAGSVLWQSLQWYQQKRRFEQQRRQDEAKIREQAALIEKAQDAILVQQTDGRVLYTNPSFERLYGWNASEFGTSDSKKLFGLSEQRCAEARKVALATGEWMGEMEHASRDGREFTVASRCTLIKDEQGQPKSFLFINTDVTEKKRLELEFFRAQRTESLGALAGGMAHDLNNALSPILMGLQLLQKQRLDEETQRMLSVMEGNTHRSADMVKQVLLFCRGRDSEKEPLSLGSLVREMERIVRQTFPKSVNVAAMVPADLWPVLGNATQLHQVLLNLCVNARDAMPRGGELTLAADNIELNEDEARQIPNGAAGRFVMVLVSDTGSGIPPEMASRIFEPFFTTKPVGKGTGLGLATVARIISQHHGFIKLASEAGRGTTFEIYLPSATIAPTQETIRLSPADFRRGRGELILVADDEQSVREMISLALGEQGFQVVTADNGAEAIARLEEHGDAVRLALLDTDMPVMNGSQAIPVLRALSPKLPVVVMSGEIAGISAMENITALSKPFQLHELLDAVAKSLEAG